MPPGKGVLRPAVTEHDRVTDMFSACFEDF